MAVLAMMCMVECSGVAKPYEDDAGRFQVQFSRPPIQRVDSRRVFGRHIDTSSWCEGVRRSLFRGLVERYRGQGVWCVTAYELPELGSGERLAPFMAEELEAEIASMEGGLRVDRKQVRVLLQDEIIQHGIPGRHIEVEAATGYRAAVRVFVRGLTVYEVSVRGRTKEVTLDKSRAFLDSFQIRQGEHP